MVGRAGRDGRPSDCVLFSGRRDAPALRRFAERDVPEADALRDLYRSLRTRAADGVAVASADELAEDEHDPRVLVGMLEQAGLVRRGFDRGRAMSVELLPPPAGRRPSGWRCLLARARAQALARADRIAAFGESHRCRQVEIAEHFGEAAAPCGVCDRCSGAAAPRAVTARGARARAPRRHRGRDRRRRALARPAAGDERARRDALGLGRRAAHGPPEPVVRAARGRAAEPDQGLDRDARRERAPRAVHERGRVSAAPRPDAPTSRCPGSGAPASAAAGARRRPAVRAPARLAARARAGGSPCPPTWSSPTRRCARWRP